VPARKTCRGPNIALREAAIDVRTALVIFLKFKCNEAPEELDRRAAGLNVSVPDIFPGYFRQLNFPAAFSVAADLSTYGGIFRFPVARVRALG
jgi:hypothetical protein